MSNDNFKPISFDENLINIKQMNEIESVITDLPDMEKINKYIDSLESENIIHPKFYGYAFKYNKDLNSSGSWDTLKNGDMIWRYYVICPGAYTVNFVFEDFHISKNAHISFYSEDKKSLLGPYTNRINNENGKFVSHLIEDSSVFIELFVPYDEVEDNSWEVNQAIKIDDNTIEQQYVSYARQQELGQSTLSSNFIGDAEKFQVLFDNRKPTLKEGEQIAVFFERLIYEKK